jgi:FAD/FMN-containing dehydrogenase
MVTVMGNWTDPGADAANIAWVREAWSEVDALGTGATYLNFGEEGDDTTTRAFGPNLERLAQIKSVYDPDNFFRRTNNIRPA